MGHIAITRCSIRFRRRPAPSSRRAFTLIELLVTITVVAVLIAVLLPALRGAIGISRSTVCLANLATVGKAHAMWSDVHDDAWLNLFISNITADLQSYAADNNSFYFPQYGMQADIWLLGLMDPRPTAEGYVLDPGVSYEAYSCPVVFVDEVSLPEGRAGDDRPHLRPLHSYYYTPTLFTSASFWREANGPLAAEDIKASDRRLVRTSDVRFTSSKVAMAERADFHAAYITNAAEPGTESLNSLFTDGHATRVLLEDTTRPIPTSGFGFETFQAMVGTPGHPIRVPFRSTPDGYLGRDVSR